MSKNRKQKFFQTVVNPNGTVRHEAGRVIIVEDKRNGVSRRYVRDAVTNEPVLKKEEKL